MKSVLLSIKPKYCELIASGKKTLEIRKNRPKIDVPFKCYVYCTKGKESFWIFNERFESEEKGNGKVIGEFICDYISVIPPIGLVDVVDCECSCLDPGEIMQYANGKYVYAWYISDLVIYDKPKEIDWFRKPIECHRGKQRDHCNGCWDCEITRPPQSWCYVERLE